MNKECVRPTTPDQSILDEHANKAQDRLHRMEQNKHKFEHEQQEVCHQCLYANNFPFTSNNYIRKRTFTKPCRHANGSMSKRASPKKCPLCKPNCKKHKCSNKVCVPILRTKVTIDMRCNTRFEKKSTRLAVNKPPSIQHTNTLFFCELVVKVQIFI